MRPLNLSNLPRRRFNNKPNTPVKIFMMEGDDFMSAERGNPYEIDLYQSIQDAIELGIIKVDATDFIKGTYANDTEAIADGLVEGDVYELSQTNTLDPAFFGLLKIVRQNVVIVGIVLGTGTPSEVIGTGTPGEVIGY